jgi:carboxymethylenebutenolidase
MYGDVCQGLRFRTDARKVPRMNELERYLSEEIAIDHADGFITRREALRRLGLLGVSAAAASALLAACAKQPPNNTAATAAPASAVPAATPPVTASSSATAEPSASAAPAPPPKLPPALDTEATTFDGPEKRKLQGAWAAAAKPRGAVLVIHENKGLTDHIKQVAGRFAAADYSALAVDLLSEEGGTASLGDPANATAALGKAPPERFVADMRAAIGELARRVPKKKIGAIGFCFGGGMVWRLIASKDPRLAAAVPFYGPFPEGADFKGSKAAVLAVYADRDERVNASRDTAKAALEKAGLVHEIVSYPGDHAFHNDITPRYNAESATKAWQRALEWYGHHLG